MPEVGGKKYPYTKEGVKEAFDAAEKGLEGPMFPDPETAEEKDRKLRKKVKEHDAKRRKEAKDKGMTLEELIAFKKKGTSGFKKGGTVRGAGIARKGVRPCKMR